LEAELSLFSPEKKQQALRAEQVVAGFVTTSGGALFVHGLCRKQETENYDELAMIEGAEKDFFRLVADLDIQFLEKNGITVTQETADQFYTIPTQNLQAYILYAKGRQAEAMFDYDGAKAAYQEASEADPDFEQAEEGSDRVEQQIAAAVEVPVQTSTPVQTEDLFTNPVEQPPSVEEKNVPPTSNTGKVIIDFQLPER
jgi:tetratricopeptide (TPR) repeat protein